MAVRPRQPEQRQAMLTHAQMQAATLKINRRITDIDNFDVDSVNERKDPRIGTLHNKLETLLVEIFGIDTVEYARYVSKVTRLDTAGWNTMRATPLHEVREGLRHGLHTAKTELLSIREWFEEELVDSGLTDASRAIKAYQGLELHPVIEAASGQLFRDGHYAHAVETAVKALNELVRSKSGVDKDGMSLMETVFSPKNPILKVNPLVSASDIDEQKGFMMMFSGAVSGLRNPRAHEIIVDDPERALEFVAFVSLLAKIVDKSTL